MSTRPVLPPRPVPGDKHVYGEVSFWVKKVEARLIKERKLRVIIRPDARDNPKLKQWLPMFTPVPIFFLDTAAADGGPLGFEEDDGTTITVERRTVCCLKDVVDADLSFNDGRAVPESARDVRRYLEEELSPGRTFNDDNPVTIYWIEYLA